MLRLAACLSHRPLHTLIEIPQVERSRGYGMDKVHVLALAALYGLGFAFAMLPRMAAAKDINSSRARSEITQ